jgi:hypothetical protein
MSKIESEVRGFVRCSYPDMVVYGIRIKSGDVPVGT